MISKTIGFRDTLFSDTPTLDLATEVILGSIRRHSGRINRNHLCGRFDIRIGGARCVVDQEVGLWNSFEKRGFADGDFRIYTECVFSFRTILSKYIEKSWSLRTWCSDNLVQNYPLSSRRRSHTLRMNACSADKCVKQLICTCMLESCLVSLWMRLPAFVQVPWNESNVNFQMTICSHLATTTNLGIDQSERICGWSKTGDAVNILSFLSFLQGNHPSW